MRCVLLPLREMRAESHGHDSVARLPVLRFQERLRGDQMRELRPGAAHVPIDDSRAALSATSRQGGRSAQRAPHGGQLTRARAGQENSRQRKSGAADYGIGGSARVVRFAGQLACGVYAPTK